MDVKIKDEGSFVMCYTWISGQIYLANIWKPTSQTARFDVANPVSVRLDIVTFDEAIEVAKEMIYGQLQEERRVA